MNKNCITLKKIKDKNIEILSPLEDIHSYSSVKVKCRRCGHIWNAVVHDLAYDKYGCRRCFSRMLANEFRLSVNEVDKRFKKCHLKRITRYYNADIEVKTRCLICGHVWWTSPSAVFEGHGCPHCASRKIGRLRRDSDQVFMEKLKSRNQHHVKILSKYKGMSNPIKVKCLTCGYIWDTSPDSLLQGCGCPHCSAKSSGQKQAYNTKWYRRRIKSLYGDRYIILGKYHRTHEGVKTLCTECGFVWYPSPANLQRGYGCPVCDRNGSHGEGDTILWLSKHGLIKSRSRDYRCKNGDYVHACNDIPWLQRYGEYLHLDFWIPELRIAIEINGTQHYKPSKHFGGKRVFKLQKARDIDKKDRCKLEGVKLISIPTKGLRHKRRRRYIWNQLDRRVLPFLKGFNGGRSCPEP